MVKINWDLTHIHFPLRSVCQIKRSLSHQFSVTSSSVLWRFMKAVQRKQHNSWLTMRACASRVPQKTCCFFSRAFHQRHHVCPPLASAACVGECGVSSCWSTFYSSTNKKFSQDLFHCKGTETHFFKTLKDRSPRGFADDRIVGRDVSYLVSGC